MRKKVSFIDPPGPRDGLNVGLGYIASSLKEDGYRVRVFDLNNNPRKLSDLNIKELKKSDIIGISVLPKTYKKIKSIIGFLNNHDILKNSVLVAGGSYVTTLPAAGSYITTAPVNFMKKFPRVDVGIKGEGEKLIKKICKNESFRKIKGIIYRKNGEIKENEGRGRVEDLESLPFPNYDCFDSVANKKIETYPLLTSRGCPYNCKFCSVPQIGGKKWRYRTPENIVSEIKYAMKNYEIGKIKIWDNNFTFKPERAKKFCRLLNENDIDINWSIPLGIRADKFDQELANLFKSSGCGEVVFGIDSCTKEVFEKIEKGLELKDIEEAIEKAKEANLKVGGYLIVGLPFSSFYKDLKSIKLSKKLNLDKAEIYLFVPYPGSDLYQEAKYSSDIKFISDWKEAYPASRKPQPVIETPHYSEEEQINAYYIGNIEHENFDGIIEKNRHKLYRIWDIIFSTLKYRPKKFFKILDSLIRKKLRELSF